MTLTLKTELLDEKSFFVYNENYSKVRKYVYINE